LSEYELSSPSPSPSPPHKMSQQQQQQQQGESSLVSTPYLPPPSREEQLLSLIATLQQQRSRVEVTRPPMFSGKMEEVSMFINATCLYLRMKINGEVATTQIAWVLLYVQEGVTEVWKDNLLDELAKGESEIEMTERLFTKIRNEFGETLEEKRKIEQLQTIEQGGRTCDEYIQEFKKVARGSSYEGRPLIEEFKRGLNGAIKRKLAEAEKLLSTIGEWQERAVRLDRNQRQSRAEERILGKNAVCPGGNTQPRRGYGGGSYGGRGGQIMWRQGETSGGYREGGNTVNRGENQLGPQRDPNAIDVNRGREEDRTCYIYGKWGHMAKNCWERHKGRVVEMPQELAKDNGGQ